MGVADGRQTAKQRVDKHQAAGRVRVERWLVGNRDVMHINITSGVAQLRHIERVIVVMQLPRLQGIFKPPELIQRAEI